MYGTRPNAWSRPALAAGALAGASWVAVWWLEPGLAVSGIVSRAEIWRLTVFTEATLVLLVALSVWIGQRAGSRGVRDVERVGPDGGRDEAGEDAPVVEGRRGGENETGTGPGWATRFGLVLMTIYAAGWLATGLLE